jgi:hypothetical protein
LDLGGGNFLFASEKNWPWKSAGKRRPIVVSVSKDIREFKYDFGAMLFARMLTPNPFV